MRATKKVSMGQRERDCHINTQAEHKMLSGLSAINVFLCRPLQRMAAGMLLASFAFILAAVVQFKVDAGDTTLKAGETKLVMFNALPASQFQTPFRIASMDVNVSFSMQPGEVRLAS